MAVGVVAPWLWFVVRDRYTIFNALATGLPVAVALVALLTLVLAALVRSPLLLLVTASWAGFWVAAVIGPWLPHHSPAPRRPITLVAANVYDRNRQLPKGLADVMRQQGDVVVITEAALHAYSDLRPRYPYAQLAPDRDQVVLSRYRLRRIGEQAAFPVPFRTNRWTLDAPGGPVTLYTVHLSRPHGTETRDIRHALVSQADAVRLLLASVANESRPAIVAGDFNLSDRTREYRKLASALRDAMRARRAAPTYDIRLRYRPFLLRIDHLFESRSWCARDSHRFTIRGSDHRGVAAVVGPCPS